MKKLSLGKKVNKKRILNRLGMTYIELLCALSLLSLIIVLFTPMLLSSYETVYKAGVRVEDAYDSKEEIEEKLSTRLEENLLEFEHFNLESNANAALYQVEITGKKIVSSLTKGLETAFGVARARVRIISPRIVYDDQNNHDVIVQVKGLNYNKVSFGKYTYANDQAFINASKTNGGLIHIEVTVPQKAMTSDKGVSEALAYNSTTGLATVKVKDKIKDGEIEYKTPIATGESLSNTRDNGRIYLNISSGTSTELDFTQSPVRIKVYYVDNRDKVKTTCDYLVIEPPTILFAGEANSQADYYTSAGVVQKGGTYKLEVNPRKMRLSNSGALVDGTDNPASVNNFDGTTGTAINTVTWVDADENPHLKPYYVMAGTYSRVYRMYNYKEATTIADVFPQTDKTRITSFETKDKSVVLSDGSVATPSFWSGDMSDQYYFKTLEHSSGYGTGDYVGTDCTQAQGDSDGYRREHKGTRYDYFDKTLRYSMSFNGFSTGYDYQHLANRRISYVLTEVGGGRSFRLSGRLKDGEFSDYSLPWEPAGAYYQGAGSRKNFGKIFGSYYRDNEKVLGKPRIIGGNNDSNSPYYSSHESPYPGPVYFEKLEDGLIGNSQNKHTDVHFAYVRLKSYISVDPINSTKKNDDNFIHRFNKGDFWWPEYYNEDPDTDKPVKNQYPNNWDWLSQDTANSVNVTSSAFIPGAGSDGQGQVIYFGTVPAYAFIEQGSDTGEAEEPLSLHTFNGANAISSRQTGYIVTGTQGKGSTIYRYFNVAEDEIDSVSDYFMNHWKNGSGKIETENNRATFYTYPKSDKALKYIDNNLEFTFGYCSRWRMAIGDVTCNGVEEVSRSYEKYYVDCTHGGATYKTKKVTPKEKYDINDLGADNLYYNVWFPGEYYNLIHTATLDEVTVAVGYAVSGSTFMKESAAWNSEYSNWGANKTGSNSEEGNGAYFGTALGSIYNDAVMAAYISKDSGGDVYTEGLAGKGEQNVIFENVLYFKNHEFINTENKNGEDGDCPWYLHARESIRFTAVDLYTVAPHLEIDSSGAATVADVTATKQYFAVYGDSNGNAYYSKIATATVTADTDADEEASEDVSLCTGDNAVPLTPVTAKDLDEGSNGMCEIKVGGKQLSEFFSEIKTISVENDIMIITGPQKDANTVEQIVIGTRSGDDTNEWNFKVVKNGTFKSIINCAKVIGGYYYIGGNGWIAAVSVNTLRNLEDGATILNEDQNNSDKGCKTKDPNKLIWDSTYTNIYSFDGRDTRG